MSFRSEERPSQLWGHPAGFVYTERCNTENVRWQDQGCGEYAANNSIRCSDCLGIKVTGLLGGFPPSSDFCHPNELSRNWGCPTSPKWRSAAILDGRSNSAPLVSVDIRVLCLGGLPDNALYRGEVGPQRATSASGCRIFFWNRSLAVVGFTNYSHRMIRI